MPNPSNALFRVVTLLVPLVFAGCGSLSGSSAPPQKEHARLEILIEANRDLNLDLKGRGAPMLLRVYELKSDVAFQDADFFALQNSDKATLGADLLTVDQFVIRPGETREIRRKSNPETTAIGFFAGYRDLPSAVRRVVHKLPSARRRWRWRRDPRQRECRRNTGPGASSTSEAPSAAARAPRFMPWV